MTLTNLKEFAIVAYLSTEDAENAFNAGLKHFNKSKLSSTDLSCRDENVVYLQAGSSTEKARMIRFLQSLHGAQPEGCRCKFSKTSL